MAATQQLTSLFGNRLSSAYNSLRGDLGAPQTATETIDKLVERIQTSAAVEDRRTAVLGLKGLSRDWRDDVGSRSMSSLIAVLQHDAPYDTEIAKATLETLMQLCELAEKPGKDDLGLKYTDVFLEAPQPLHHLLMLLSTSPSFYPRFYTLQFLSQLLHARPTVAQGYIMSAPPPGVDGILTVLDARAPPPGGAPGTGAGATGMGGGAGEMLRNEALLLLPPMLGGNPDLQKIVAFSGAFERLFEIIQQEGGSDGGIVVQDAMTVVAGLLRFNVSNQNYFRELSLIPSLPPILGFPSGLANNAPSPDEFALQYWPEQKLYNAGQVLGLIRSLIGGPGGGNQPAMVNGGVTRCLLELALASNAPNSLKSQALNTLTPILLSSVPNQTLLSQLVLSPLVAIHADAEHPNGGFMRIPPRPAVVSLVSAVVDGDPSAGGRGLRCRAAGVNMFESYVTGNDDARIGILTSLGVPPSPDTADQTVGPTILSGLLDLPSSPDDPFDPYRSLFACLLLAHLVRNSEHAKKLAREVSIATTPDADDDDKVGLVQLVVGNLMMAAREQTECANRAAKEGRPEGSTEEEDWTRVMVGYLVLLCTWLWDSPKTVKEFLSESANLQVLIQPITQATGIDPLVQGLSAFLLGVCYEFNREPGEITRSTLHPILHSRIGPDQFVSRMARLREDPRFKAVQPDAFENGDVAEVQPPEVDEELEEGLELWFDWAFVDFWKNHYYTIQRSIAIDPDAVRGPASTDDGETAAIIMSLRQKLKTQTDEVVALQTKLANLSKDHGTEKEHLAGEVQALSEQVAALTTSLHAQEEGSQAHGKEVEQMRSRHGEEVDRVRAELEDVKARLEGATQDRGEVDKLQDELGKAKARVEELEKAGEEARGAIKAREEEIEGLKSSLSAGEGEVERLKAEVERLKAEIESLKKVGKEKDERVKELEAAKAAAAAADEPESTGPGKKKKGKGGKAGGDDDKDKAEKAEKAEMEKRLKDLEVALAEEKAKREEGEKEHEDLLVLLEELSSKRKADKLKMREGGMEVSEGEEEEDDEEGDDE